MGPDTPFRKWEIYKERVSFVKKRIFIVSEQVFSVMLLWFLGLFLYFWQLDAISIDDMIFSAPSVDGTAPPSIPLNFMDGVVCF